MKLHEEWYVLNNREERYNHSYWDKEIDNNREERFIEIDRSQIELTSLSFIAQYHLTTHIEFSNHSDY